MKQSIRVSFVVFALLLASCIVNAEYIPMAVYVDGVNIGEVSVNVDSKLNATHFKLSDITDLLKDYLQPDKVARMQSLKEADDSISFLSLTRLGITPSYEEKELRVLIDIPLEIRAVKDFPALILKSKTGLSVNSKSFSGYLNMRGTLGYNESKEPLTYSYQQNPAEGQLELVQNFHFFTFESTANYKEFEAKPIERAETSIVHDIVSKQVRVRLGDYVTTAQSFQSSLPAGGIQVQKQVSIYPNRGSINRRSANLNIRTNSLMELYVNDNLISRIRVNAGPYNLKDLPLLFGRNKVRVVLKNDFGGVEEFEVEMLFDDQILAKGANEFSYQIGKPSQYIGIEKQYKDETFGSFYHKYGLTDTETLMVNYQNYKSSRLVGLGLGWLTKFGTHFFDVAAYIDDTVTSSGASRWRYNSPDLEAVGLSNFRLFGSAEFRSSKFKTISILTPTITNFSERYELIFQKQLSDVSSFSLGLTRTRGENFGANDLIRRINYQTQFAQNWRFDVGYSWSEQQPDLDQVLLTLNWFEPEGKAQASVSHNTVDSNSTVRVTKNRKQNYNDMQLDIAASTQRARATKIESQNISMSGNYYATIYEARAQYTGVTSEGGINNSGQFGFGTALAWTSESIGISRPITDSFAIVKTEGLGRKQYLTIPNGVEKDSLKISNNERFVFADLTAYVERPLQLDSTHLGAGARLERESYVLSPTYRSGMFIPLKVVRSILAKGRLKSATKEQVEYLNGKILSEDGKVYTSNFFTDDSGNFVIDGLSYGKYQIELADKRYKKINFEIVELPDSEEEVQAEDSEFDLGTLKLEKEAGS